MRITRFAPYKGEGVPIGIKDKDWKIDPRDGNYIVLEYERIIDDKSEEAMEIRKRAKTKQGYFTNLTDMKCEKCGSFIEKYPLVPHPKLNRLGWTARYICSNNDCLEERLVKE
jgi:hypothetical protein